MVPRGQSKLTLDHTIDFFEMVWYGLVLSRFFRGMVWYGTIDKSDVNCMVFANRKLTIMVYYPVPAMAVLVAPACTCCPTSSLDVKVTTYPHTQLI